VKEIYFAEYRNLREELHLLKKCQMDFLTWSTVVTIAYLSLAAKFLSQYKSAIFFLFPLGIILPSWWIFFDKATTITRIVGYCRILEKLINGQVLAKRYVGWENALRIFREEQKGGRLKFESQKTFWSVFWKDLLPLGLIIHTRRYWLLAHYTFFALSVLCWIVFLRSPYVPWREIFPWKGWCKLLNLDLIVTGVMIFFTVISVVWNYKMIYYLMHGRESDNAKEQFWRKILEIEDKNNPKFK